MRKITWVGAICLLAAAGLAVAAGYQPLNIKTGYWETSMTSSGTGSLPFPPEVLAKMTAEQKARFEAAMKSTMAKQTRDYKHCITKEQLEKNPFSDPKQNCTWTVLNSTGSGMEAKGSCGPGRAGSAGTRSDVAMKIQALDNEHIKGTGQIAIVGTTGAMKTDFSMVSKWLGAACPAEK